MAGSADGGERGHPVSGGRWALLISVPVAVVGAWAVILRLDVGKPVQVISTFAVLTLGIILQTKLLKGRKRDL